MKNNKSSLLKILVTVVLIAGLFTAGCLENAKVPSLKKSKSSKSSMPEVNLRKIKYPKLGDIQFPEITRVTLPNGIKLFLLEDHELPLINASVVIRSGTIYDPVGKIGLAEITGEVMRTGGTTSKTGDEIDELLESIAASVETRVGSDSASIYMSVLKEDIDTVLEIMADILQNPAFPEDKIELAKIEQTSAIARRNDNPGSIAQREYYKLIYGPDSVYARQTEYAAINSITRGELVAFHKQYFLPNNARLAVWGDFDTTEMVEKITKAFDMWKQGNILLSYIPDVTYDFPTTVNLIRKDDINQSNIYLGHIGGVMNDPDYFALILMNRVLGQGFTSRLFRNIRSRMGLAYSVFGNYSSEYDHPGVFFVGCQTKSAETVKAVEAMKNEIRRMAEVEVTKEELEIARESFLNTFVFNFDSKAEIISRLVTYDYYGYPEDFLFQMKRNVEEVTGADILRVSQKHLNPNSLQILVVGKAADFDQPLDVLGEVREIDITIPNP